MRCSVALVLGCALVGCVSSPSHPPTGCDIDSGGCAAGSMLPSAVGGGGTRDAGHSDGAVGDAVANVSGRVLLAASVPLATSASSSSAASAWTVTPLALPAGVALSATTDTEGRFALANVPVVDGTYILRADPPAGGGTLGAVAEFYPSSGSSTFFAINDSALASSLVGTGVTPSSALGHIVLEALDGSTRVSGIRVAADASSASIAYDDASGGLSTAADRTGVLGTAAILNVDAPAGGRYVGVQLTRVATTSVDAGVVTYGVYVLPGHVSFVSTPAPP